MVGRVAERDRCFDCECSRFRQVIPEPNGSQPMSEHEFQPTWMLSGRCEFCNRPADEHDDPTPEEFADPANWHPIEEHPYLNDPPKVTVSDNLRDRIAAVIDGVWPDGEKRDDDFAHGYLDEYPFFHTSIEQQWLDATAQGFTAHRMDNRRQNQPR
jgi:hypothetical protein